MPATVTQVVASGARSIAISASVGATVTGDGALSAPALQANTNVSGGAAGNFVLSNDASKLFVGGSDGVLRVFDSASGALLGSSNIGTRLGAIDISPDGTFLLITEQQPAVFNQVSPWWNNTTESLVYRVSTSTFALQQTYRYQSTGSDYTLADVAITASGNAVFTENILPGWSGWTPMVTLDLTTGTFNRTANSSFYQSGSLTTSPDRTTVLFGQLGLSSAEARIFSPNLTQLAYNGVYQNNVNGYASGIEAFSGSGASGRVAIFTGGSLHLWNGNFGYIANLSATNAVLGAAAGLKFSADGQTLYVWSRSNGNVYGISMSTLTITDTLAGSTNYPTNTAWGDEIILPPDDGAMFLSTAAGIVRVELSNIASGTEGDDVFAGLARRDVYSGRGGNDLIHGNAGADDLAGGAGDDIINGGGGDDVLDGGIGNDQLIGGLGNDIYVVDAVADTVTEAVGEGNDRALASVSYRLSAAAEVELLSAADQNGTAALDLRGNDFAQAVFGNNGSNYLEGRGGSDVLYGLGDTDYLDGGRGADRLIGGSGDDWYYVDDTGDVVVENASEGYDRVLTTASFTLAAGAEIELLSVINQLGTEAINLAGNNIAQALFGNEAANTIEGLGGNDTLYGLGGDDLLDGGAGIDQLRGGTGNDSYLVDSLSDAVYEDIGAGTDTVRASVSFTLAASAEVEFLATTNASGTGAIDLAGNSTAQTVTGNAGSNYLEGRGGNDILYGLSGNDYLDGGTGVDQTYGGTGNDWYYVDDANDIVVENVGEGYDRVLATASYRLSATAEIELLTAADQNGSMILDLRGNDFAQGLFGNEASNILEAFGGNDVIYGLGGNDLLDGGLGVDQLYGGTGADRFAFSTALDGNNIDRLADFASGSDQIALSQSVFAALGLGSIAAGQFVAGPAALDADDRIVYDAATGTIWYDADGNGGGAALAFALLTPGTTLTASDFIVV